MLSTCSTIKVTDIPEYKRFTNCQILTTSKKSFERLPDRPRRVAFSPERSWHGDPAVMSTNLADGKRRNTL
eukprot:4821195-Karenia_brevis.AAC.1